MSLAVFPEADVQLIEQAYTVATIAKYDWPDFWPTLMDDLIGLLKHGSEGQLEGAMDVVTELVREDLGQDQLPAIASNLLPALLDILRNTEVRCCCHTRSSSRVQS